MALISEQNQPLTVDMVLSVLAVMCGAEGWEDIEEFGHIRKGWLKKFIKLKNGIPSHDTISCVFRMLKPDAFQAAFREWLIEMELMGGADIIAIDGKNAEALARRTIQEDASQRECLERVEQRYGVVSSMFGLTVPHSWLQSR